MDTRQLAEDNLLFLTIVGSHAYGMATEHSDVDKKGFFFAPKDVVVSPFVNVEQVEAFRGEKDSVVYELTKWLKLTADCNPNVLELLWVDEQHILEYSDVYTMLRNEREVFLCSKVKHTFSGYAMSQLKRIRGHNKWITKEQRAIEKLYELLRYNRIDDEFVKKWFSEAVAKQLVGRERYCIAPLCKPTDHEVLTDPDIAQITKRRPKERDFISIIWNATGNKDWNKKVPFEGFTAWELGNDTYGLIQCHLNVKGSPSSVVSWLDKHEAIVAEPVVELTKVGFTGAFPLIVKFNKQLYKEHLDNWNHYWEWKNNRNEARSQLEELHGYDTKHASHLIRLLRMGVEILRGEGVQVLRKDADELLDIRRGKWSYEELVSYADELDNEMDSLYESTKLPFAIDVRKAENLLLKAYDICWD